MDLWKRLALATLVVIVDLIAFAVPVTAIAIAYILVARPPKFLNWVLLLYGSPGNANGRSKAGEAG
jgi:hypothetical protein